MATVQVKKDADLVSVKRGAVFGSGAFGTALATVLAKTCKQVTVWHMNEKQAQEINQKHENVYFLKGPKLAENITYTADVKKTLDGANVILFVIPTQFMRGFLKQWGPLIKEKLNKDHTPVLVCTKGIERSTLKFPAQIVEEFLPNYPVSVLAGPSFAIEVAKGMYTNVCVASHGIDDARHLQRLITTPDRMFRCWATTDTIGCEVASAVKNVLAIASGVASGLGMGLNARAALITRGLLEIRDLTAALGGNGSAIFGLAGLGDLLLTCSSELSRNFSVGFKLGKGQSFEDIMRNSKAVAEGVATAQPLFHLAKKKRVNMPICEQVYRVVYENKKAIEAFATLRDMGLSDEGLPPLSRASIRQTSPWAHL